MKQFKQAMARLFSGTPRRSASPRRSVVPNKLRAEAERLGCEIESVEGGGFNVWPPADMQPADDPFASFHYADDTTTARWMLQEYARVLKEKTMHTNLAKALPHGVSVEDCIITTLAELAAEYDINIDIADIGDAPTYLLPGWYADDGNAEVYFPDAEDGRAAAREYVEGGDWGELNRTDWVDVWAWRRALALDEDGRVITIELDRARHTIEIEPEEPDCTHDEHDWRERDVRGHGGGVIITDICVRCGRYRIHDTWAQRRDTGEQGLESIEYRDADES